MSPAKAVEHLRLEAARERIEHSSTPIELIAAAVGFRDPERMRRAFLRAFGQPPQAMRRSQQGQSRFGLNGPTAIKPVWSEKRVMRPLLTVTVPAADDQTRPFRAERGNGGTWEKLPSRTGGLFRQRSAQAGKRDLQQLFSEAAIACQPFKARVDDNRQFRSSVTVPLTHQQWASFT